MPAAIEVAEVGTDILVSGMDGPEGVEDIPISAGESPELSGGIPISMEGM